MTRPHATALLAAALASFVLAPTAAAQADSQIKIGLIGPFTGGSADFGNSMRNGVELAVSEINALGGYVGRKFELVVRDDKANPELARQMSEELVKEGVLATIGFCNSGNAVKSLDIYQKARVPLIVPLPGMIASPSAQMPCSSSALASPVYVSVALTTR